MDKKGSNFTVFPVGYCLIPFRGIDKGRKMNYRNYRQMNKWINITKAYWLSDFIIFRQQNYTYVVNYKNTK